MMSSNTTPRKRITDEEEDLPTFEDPADLINAVISTLQTPEEKTNVLINYANDKNLATEVQAYAKIAGQDWTFYVKSLAISIGRNTDNKSDSSIDIDLGPAKVVSRQHAAITYNLDLRCWELKVLGRNGARIDSQKIPVGSAHATPLHSGAILDVGGTQMMFILPDSPPNILEKMMSICLAKYKANLLKSRKRSQLGYPQQHTIPVNHNSQIKSFQMFDKAQLTQSPSSASANSLQSNLDQDLSKEEAKDIKPPYSYATMITQAILSNDEGVMSLSEIYNWISSHYAYYKYSKTGWQNSIRHNLSLNKAFEKVPRRPNEPGKGMKWQISESYKEEFLNKINNGSLLKTRRGSSVSRQLQLHLATHQQLPESQKFLQRDSQRQDDSNFNMVNTLPKLGNSLQYQQIPVNQMQNNQMSYMPNQQNSYSQRSYNFQQPAPHMMFGGPLMQQPQQPQQFHNSQLSLPQKFGQSQLPTSIQGFGDNKGDLSSPMKPLGDSNTATPKLPKVANTKLFNLPPPPSQIHGNPITGHSRLNSLNQSQMNENNHNYSSGNSSNDTSNALGNSTAPSTNSDAIGFTSPKKIAPLEAFTPERGSKAASNGKLGLPSGNPNHSSPAFWNFVQFSTPNGQTPVRKDSEELNTQASPTLGRKVNGGNNFISKNNDTNKSELSFKSKDENDEENSEKKIDKQKGSEILA